jgi:hypothetical protein
MFDCFSFYFILKKKRLMKRCTLILKKHTLMILVNYMVFKICLFYNIHFIQFTYLFFFLVLKWVFHINWFSIHSLIYIYIYIYRCNHSYLHLHIDISYMHFSHSCIDISLPWELHHSSILLSKHVMICVDLYMKGERDIYLERFTL